MKEVNPKNIIISAIIDYITTKKEKTRTYLVDNNNDVYRCDMDIKDKTI